MLFSFETTIYTKKIPAGRRRGGIDADDDNDNDNDDDDNDDDDDDATDDDDDDDDEQLWDHAQLPMGK